MHEWLKKNGEPGMLCLAALFLMYTGLLSGFAHVMASNERDYEAKYLEQANLIRENPSFIYHETAQATQVSAVPALASTQSTKAEYQSFKLIDESGNAVKPIVITQVDKNIYLLGNECLYMLPEIAGSHQEEKVLGVTTIPVPQNKIKGIPIQEFLSFSYFQPHKSIVVLDKSGSLFEYILNEKKWQLLRANKQTLGSPDPHYVALCSDGTHILLLDPERNQIWRVPSAAKNARYFKEVLPWRIKAGDPNVADGIDIAFDGSTFVLRRSGKISIYPKASSGGNGNPKSLHWKVPAGAIPSRMSVAPHSPCYIVERENCRVLAVDKAKSSTKQFIFPKTSDLRGLLPGYGGFCIIDGANLVFRMLNEPEANNKLSPREIDRRLRILQVPIKGGLPRHPGVYPGARRLYRHGVHQGLDFFHDPGAGTQVAVNTPALAAACGKVIRADTNYHDMDARQYNKIMSECAASQFCTEANEDLFRGCQVWIDHGNGLVTRYAHLNKARADLRVGMQVKAGETVGFIGYSGTGENQPGRVKHPHLHFEIWLDGHYLGYGLTPAETMAYYQKLFAASKRGH